ISGSTARYPQAVLTRCLLSGKARHILFELKRHAKFFNANQHVSQIEIARSGFHLEGAALEQSRSAGAHYSHATLQSRLRLLQRIRPHIKAGAARSDEAPRRQAR